MNYFGELIGKLLLEVLIVLIAGCCLAIFILIVYGICFLFIKNEKTMENLNGALLIYALISWINVIIWRVWDNRVGIWSIFIDLISSRFTFNIFIWSYIGLNVYLWFGNKKELTSKWNWIGVIVITGLMIVFYNN